ncbi:hypothetical protein L7F22_023741 [Adiantum nelumboides]|nr:hypothetical protein [Adiantum nelumboides]
MPRIEYTLERLDGEKCFTKIDLKSGYHQIRIFEADIPKVAFRSELGHYEFVEELETGEIGVSRAAPWLRFQQQSPSGLRVSAKAVPSDLRFSAKAVPSDLHFSHPSGLRFSAKALPSEGECFKDHLTLAVPSDRETAVWGALQTSELGFQEAFQGPANDVEQLKSNSSLNATVEEEQFFRDCLGNGPMHGMEDKIMVADGSQQRETNLAEASSDTQRPEVQLLDGWDHVNADIDGIHEHVVGQSSIKSKSHDFVKPKGTNKKKLHLSFRSMHNVHRAQQDDKQRNECQNLSLAQKLRSLVEPSAEKTETQAVSKSLGSCARVPISEKLLQLQNGSKHNLNKKVKKKPDLPAKTSLNLCIKEDFREKASSAVGDTPSENINDQFRRALLEAPPASAEELNRQGKIQGTNSGFAGRLQKVLERERNERTEFLRWLQMKHNSLEGKSSCMDVKIVSKSLEARLSACECSILNCSEVKVIFNMQANSQLELDCGSVVRLYPPWQEVLVPNGSSAVKTILCTYFCEVITDHETR